MMTSRKKVPPRQVEGSWVIEDMNEGSSEYLPDDEEDVPRPSRKTRQTPERTTPRRSARMSPEPQFIMPSIHLDHHNDQPSPNSRASPRAARSPASVPAMPQSATHGTRRRKPRREPITEDSTSVHAEIMHGLTAWCWRTITRTLRIIVYTFLGALSSLGAPVQVVLSTILAMAFFCAIAWYAASTMLHGLSFWNVCSIPGAGLVIPLCATPQLEAPNIEFQKLINVQSKFESVLEDSAGGYSLPMEMKAGEASIRDLRQHVKFSNLQSRDELGFEFDQFLETARIASYDLQKFNSHVGRAVDSVIAITHWTTRVLDGISAQQSRGLIGGIISSLMPADPHAGESAVLDQYVQHTALVEEEILRLIGEAQALVMVLDNLDNRLDIIGEIALRDDQHARNAKDDVLALIWTKLGGNKGKLGTISRQLALLQNVGQYRRSAMAHVQGTALKLEAIKAELEELRERVGAPALLRDTARIPLSVHIESITRGVERLEEKRSHARREENDIIRRHLERQVDNPVMIGG